MISTSLTRIRKLIRDVDKSAISDVVLFKLYKRARLEFFGDTLPRVRGAVLPNPPSWRFSRMFEFERWQEEKAVCPFFRDPINHYSCTQPWEVQQLQGIVPTEEGGTFSSSPVDAAFVSCNVLFPHLFPSDLHQLLYAAWQGRSLDLIGKKKLEEEDERWMEREGDNVRYLCLDWPAKQMFLPYPQPTGQSYSGGGGFGVPVYYSLPLLQGTGLIVSVSSIDPEESGGGMVFEICNPLDGFALFFLSIPPSPETVGEEDVWLLRPFRKYVEFRTAALALSIHSEVKNEELEKVYKARYDLGVSIVKDLKRVLKTDIVVKKRGIHEIGSYSGGKLGRPRLPDHYPNPWR